MYWSVSKICFVFPFIQLLMFSVKVFIQISGVKKDTFTVYSKLIYSHSTKKIFKIIWFVVDSISFYAEVLTYIALTKLWI